MVGAGGLGAFATSGTAAATIACPRTPGYWKNHTDWACNFLILGGVRYEKEEVIELLGMPPKGDKSIILGKHLAATKLNICHGPGSEPAKTEFMGCVRTWRNQADGWLGDHPIGSGVRKWDGGEEIKDMLDRYNNGRLSCPADCP